MLAFAYDVDGGNGARTYGTGCGDAGLSDGDGRCVGGALDEISLVDLVAPDQIAELAAASVLSESIADGEHFIPLMVRVGQTSWEGNQNLGSGVPCRVRVLRPWGYSACCCDGDCGEECGA